MDNFYRFVVKDKGIYEAVDIDCPRGDERRKQKPDGSWLTKIGITYPGAISFWTKKGMLKYLKSGLMKWHASVVNGLVEVVIIGKPKNILYKDENQIIIYPKELKIKEKLKLEDFLKNKNNYI